MGKIGMAALVVDFLQINFGSIAETTILKTGRQTPLFPKY